MKRHVVCAEPGCPELATFRGRCPAHQRRSPSSIATSKSAHKRRRAELLEAAGVFPICHICGDPILDGRIHADHVVPIGAGGSENGPLAVAHAACNVRKGARL